MKAFDRIIIALVLLAAVLFAGVNIWLADTEEASGRQYRVDASRAAAQIEESGSAALDIEDYPSLVAVVPLDGDTLEGITGGEYDYLIKSINGRLYRFDYVTADEGASSAAVAVNIALGVLTVFVLGVLVYIRFAVLKPFFTLSHLPEELSRGNLSMPLKENKQRYFGKFVWGMDMLRERLEQSRQNELDLQSERKKLILSLSHDIKIPLSAIKLYSKAISKGLYDGKVTPQELAEKINQKADDIEGYVSGIINASREDMLSIEVKNGEFYLSELLDKITLFYKEKLRLNGTEFIPPQYANCLIKGDADRAVEVIQNITENAIKYGDGKRIKLTVSEDEGCRLVTVSNTGCTLPTNELPHIFDSFWRGSNSGGESGNGLGLYICRCIMHQMNGEVFAEIKDGEMRVTAVFSPV